MKKRFITYGILGGILSLGMFLAQCAFGQTDVPYNTVTNNTPLPTNAVVMPEFIGPSAPGTPTLPSSPASTTNFQGLGDNSVLTPPDTDGAVGPNHVVTMLNTQVRIQNRSGTTINTTTLLSWWQAFFPGISEAFDPRITYDPYSQRWIATAGAQPPPYSSSSLLIAVSKTSDPTGGWYAFSLQADTSGTAWADFPTVGFSKDRIALSWNYYNLSNGQPNGVGIFVFNKASLYSGTLSDEFFYLPYSTYGLGICPAINYDTNTSTIYLLQDYNSDYSGSGYLALYTITGTFGSDTLNQVSFPSTPNPWADGATGDANLAPQSGTSVKIHAGDSAINQLFYRNGSLWTAQTIFLPASSPTRCSVQWWQIQTDGTIAQHGLLDDSSGVNFYAYPSIAVNRFGDAMIGYSKFSASQYASADYSLHALTDPSASLESDYVIKAGESPYWKIPSGDSRNRWGDFSRTTVDPVNDTDFWTVQEYARTYSGSLVNGSGRWGVWWANLQMPVPMNDYFTNAITISGIQGTTNGTNLRATKESGEPTIAGNAGGASIWYKWTAPTNGSVTIDTTGSGISTLIGIYTGSSVGSLTLVNSGQGQVIFTATSGTTYRIVVDGVNGSMGNVVLNWVQPAKPVFTTQPHGQSVIAGNGVTFTSFAIGTPTPTYQWYFNTTNLIGGATFSSYTNSNVSTNDAGNYSVTASNSAGSTNSAVAELTVYNSATPTLSLFTYTNNQFQFFVNGITNYNYAVQASTNLATTNWISILTNPAPFTFSDTVASNYPIRFYRALYLP
ncbi:MAG TPA: immunoglobulin domain-containing protein [Verrucomicrobiae bacterium]